MRTVISTLGIQRTPLYMFQKETPQLLAKMRTLFYLDAQGRLRNKVTRGKAVTGKIAGSSNKDDHRRICVDYEMYLMHRVVFALFHGRWPKGFLDHKDMNRANNHPDNLREATRSQNSQNTGIRRGSQSGYRNVGWVEKDQMWRVRLCVHGVRYTIGYFKNVELADLVAQEARQRLFGEFAPVLS